MTNRWHPSLRLLAAALALSAISSCKKAEPEPPAVTAPATPDAATAAAAPPPASRPPAAASAAPVVAPPAEAGPPGEAAPPASGDVAGTALEKSDELRFIEANAELLCFEQSHKKQMAGKERSALLGRHGFAGEGGEERFTALNIRGDRDREWGKRTTDRITSEMGALCPDAKPNKK